MSAWVDKLLAEKVSELAKSRTRVPYSDEGMSFFRKVMQETWDALPESDRQRLHAQAAAMTPAQWAAFSKAVIQVGPSCAEQVLNAAPEKVNG